MIANDPYFSIKFQPSVAAGGIAGTLVISDQVARDTFCVIPNSERWQLLSVTSGGQQGVIVYLHEATA